MSFLQKLQDLFHSWFPPSLDDGFGNVELSQFMKTLKSLTSSTDAIRILSGKDVKAIIGNTLLPIRNGKWEERSVYCDAITSIPKSEELFQLLQSWCEQDSRSALPYLVRGAFFIEWVWEARGLGTSDTVTDSGWKLTQERLQRAETDLLTATQLDPEDPTPYIYLLDTLKGLGIDRHPAEDYFQKGISLDPENFHLHLSMQSLLTAKWFGSHEVMFHFAKDSIAHASAGSLLPALLFHAHIERWLSPVLSLAGISSKYMSPDQQKEWSEASKYPQSKEIQEETTEALQKLRQAEGKHSQLALVLPKNYAAFWFYLSQQKEPLKMLLEELGPKQITEYPWCYDGGIPMLAYRRAKKLVSLP